MRNVNQKSNNISTSNVCEVADDTFNRNSGASVRNPGKGADSLFIIIRGFLTCMLGF